MIKKNISVDIVIPVYNEERELEKNITKLHNFLDKNFEYGHNIIIANNASTDNTLKISKKISKSLPRVS